MPAKLSMDSRSPLWWLCITSTRAPVSDALSASATSMPVSTGTAGPSSVKIAPAPDAVTTGATPGVTSMVSVRVAESGPPAPCCPPSLASTLSSTWPGAPTAIVMPFSASLTRCSGPASDTAELPLPLTESSPVSPASAMSAPAPACNVTVIQAASTSATLTPAGPWINCSVP